MARFAGKVGFGVSTEVRRGEFEDVVTERTYFGDIIRTARSADQADKVNDNLSVNNSVEIVIDEFINENLLAIRYVLWMGSRWKVVDIEANHPRLTLRLGGAYNGPTPSDA
jgi:hypothetical protein